MDEIIAKFLLQNTSWTIDRLVVKPLQIIIDNRIDLNTYNKITNRSSAMTFKLRVYSIRDMFNIGALYSFINNTNVSYAYH